jgi:hypothetical protein
MEGEAKRATSIELKGTLLLQRDEQGHGQEGNWNLA